MNVYFEKMFHDLVFNKNVEKEVFKGFKLSNYPQYLYKYKDCKEEYNFEMVEEEYLWANHPQNYDDPFDSMINLKLKSELPEIQKWIEQHIGEIIYYYIPPKGMKPNKNAHSLKAYKNAQEKFIDSKGRYNAQKAKAAMVLEMAKLSPSDRKIVKKIFARFESEAFKTKVVKTVRGHVSDIVNHLRSNNFVCCLTERKDNQKMWEGYADNYSGFVIEYDLHKSMQQEYVKKYICRMFQVKYYKRMPKVALLPFIKKSFVKTLYAEDIDISDSEKKLYLQLLVKKVEYSGEEEWRIISGEQKISFPIISAIYMGYKIKKEDEERLRGICKKKGIKIFKQRINVLDGKFIYEDVSE